MATIKSIEEKARLYDEAIRKAKDMLSYKEIRQEDIEYLFPELKENGDERIRKALKEYFINSFQNNGVAAILGVHIKDILIWIEKQGEQKPAENSGKKSEDVIEEKDMTEYKKGFECGKQRVLKYPEDFNLCKKSAAWSEEDELHISELESLVKQAWAIAEHENDKDNIHKMSDLSFFLKTLKPQLKQEYSAWDRILQDSSISYLCNLRDTFETKGWDKEQIQKCIDGLKSLKERYAWKPSELQMNDK